MKKQAVAAQNKCAQKPIILVDGSSYFYRAFHALPPLANSRGEPTGAVYGVINMIRRLIKDFEPKQMAVVFDAKGKTFRDELYPQYKATREPTPDELSIQFEPLLNIIKGMGIPLLVVEGVEADDVIGTLAAQASCQGLPLIISTGDKDMAQLVDGHVTLINTMTNTILDQDRVKEKFGVLPGQIIDYLTLIGDKVDNIPGVPKVGPKTAVRWLSQHTSLEEIINHADDISGKVGESLRACLTQLPLAKQLVTIKQDVVLEKTINELQIKNANQDDLIQLFRQLEFRGWLNELLTQQQAVGKHTEEKRYQIILDKQHFQHWLERIKQAKQFAFDSETTNLNPIKAKLVGVSFALKASEAVYVPCGHDYLNAPVQLDRDYMLRELKPILENSNIKKIGQNLKYDSRVLANYGIYLQGIAYDTMLESYVLNSASARHDMDSLALKYLGKKTINFEEIAGKGVKQLTFNQIELAKAGEYAAEDADICLQLHEVLWPKVSEIPALKQVFTKIEIPLVNILSRMEHQGVLIDAALLHQQSITLSQRIAKLEATAFEVVGESFNLSSPKQLQAILFDKLKLPILQKTPKGQASTAESVLQELAYDYPLPKIILEYRSLSKLKSTYLDALPLKIQAKTGRVHTSYNQAVTATGRLSSTDPNLQNIPVRTPEGRQIRRAFIAPEGYKIVAADYSQIELRIMAHLSKDSGLANAFEQGWDIHRATAAEVFDVAQEKVTQEQRRRAKAINFGLIYGMSSYGLARQLETSRELAQQYIDRYFHRYPGVKQYMEQIRAFAHKKGYVETLMGRRLYLPEINARNIQRQRAAERAAINAPMQGTAADLIKEAMIQMDAWLQRTGIEVQMIMQVHDELVFEVAKRCLPDALANIQKIMTHSATLNVPLIVDIGVGENWEEAH